VLRISEWPRQDVATNLLHPVVSPKGCGFPDPRAPPTQGERSVAPIRKRTEAITDSAQKTRVVQIQDLSDAKSTRIVRPVSRRSSPATLDMEFFRISYSDRPKVEDELVTAVSKSSRSFGQATWKRGSLGRQPRLRCLDSAVRPFAVR